MFQEGDTIRCWVAEFGLGFRRFRTELGGVYGYEASRRGNGVLVAWREVRNCALFVLRFCVC